MEFSLEIHWRRDGIGSHSLLSLFKLRAVKYMYKYTSLENSRAVKIQSSSHVIARCVLTMKIGGSGSAGGVDGGTLRTQHHVRFWQIRGGARSSRSSAALPTQYGYRGNSRRTSHSDGRGIYGGEQRGNLEEEDPAFALTYYRGTLSRASAARHLITRWRERDVCATRPRLSLPAFLRRGRKTGRTGTNDGRRGRFFDGYLANQTEMPAGYSRQSRWNARMFGVRHTIRLWLCYTIR